MFKSIKRTTASLSTLSFIVLFALIAFLSSISTPVGAKTANHQGQTTQAPQAQAEYILLQIDKYTFEFKPNDSYGAIALLRDLPVDIEMNRWGDQFYGPSPVNIEDDPGAKSRMEIGDVAFWPPGQSICIFFGPTPLSPGPTPKLYSPGVVLGQLKGDLTVLRNLGSKANIKIIRK